jgi:hypothetical protein
MDKIKKIDLRKPITVGDPKLGFRLLEITRKWRRSGVYTVDDTIAFAKRETSRNFIVPKGREEDAAGNLALFLLGEKNIFSKALGMK